VFKYIFSLINMQLSSCLFTGCHSSRLHFLKAQHGYVYK